MSASWLAATIALCASAHGEASSSDAPESAASSQPAPEGEAEAPTDESPARLDRMERRLDALEEDNAQLRQDNARLRQDNAALRRDAEQLRQDAERRQQQAQALDQRVQSLEQEQQQARRQLDGMLPLSGRLGGYLDIGFFYVGGDGSGIRPDTGHVVFPEFADTVPDSWTFMGDPLSTAINSRGDPADTAESRAVLFDPVDAGGKSSFIANAVNLDLTTGVGDNLVIEGMVDFIPRNRDVSNPDGVFLGDYLNVKLAYVNYIVPVERFDLDLYAGKFDPVFGYEYRIQESPDRITVTPSLMCRYTCGRPVGLKGRAKFLPNRALIVAMSVANGSTVREGFGFANEIDTNHFKTIASRVSYRFNVGAGLEVGASGQFGAQDLQQRDDAYQWQYGFDAHLDVRGVEAAAEFIMGRMDGAAAPGELPCESAPCLDLMSAYGLVGYRALNWLMPYARVDWRDALHRSGASFVYVSELYRITPGVRFDLGTHVAIKAEYTINRELGRIPQFANDVLTTSLVARL